MQRLRSTWLALIGGAFLVTLSVSAAFGAPPDPETGPRGQTVAAFVHELVFGSDETDEDEVVNEDEDESPEGDEEGDEEGSEENDELAEEVVAEEEVEEDGEVANSHGECVSEEASDKLDETDSDENHGEIVSFAAQETCWELEPADEVTDPAQEEEDAEELQLEDGDTHGDCVSEAAHDWEGFEESDAANHGEWVSEHARYTCWGFEVPNEEATEEGAEDSSVEGEGDTARLTAEEERKAEQAAARAERTADHAAAQAAQPRGGNGNGRGGRP